MAKSYEVNVIYSDGTKKYFDTFKSTRIAEYHICLALTTSGIDGYVDYNNAEFTITEIEY